MANDLEKRKALIASIRHRAAEDHEYVYGKPDLDWLTPIVADLVQALDMGAEWAREAKRKGWKAVLSEVRSLHSAIATAIKQAKEGCDPLAQGDWIAELLDRIPSDILKQKLGATSLKELAKT